MSMHVVLDHSIIEVIVNNVCHVCLHVCHVCHVCCSTHSSV